MKSENLTEGDVKVLVQLLLGSGLVTREEFARASEMSEFESIPLLTALSNTGLLTQESLRLSVEAQEKVLANEISSDLAIRAMRLSLQRRLSLNDAVASVQKLHQATQVSVSVTNELTNLLLGAKFITAEDLGRFVKLSMDSGMMIGHLLMLDNKISTDELLGALNAVVLMREDHLSKNNAAQGLRYARQRKISFEQALFELDFMEHPQAKGSRMGELFLLAGLISREDLAECYEIELFKRKSFGQIVLERGLVNAQQVQSASTLMSQIQDDKMKPYEAAEILFSIVKQGVDIDAALAERAASADDRLTLADLLVEAGVCARSDVERAIPPTAKTWGEQGSALFNAGVLNEHSVLASLRLKALVGLGYLPREKAVQILNYCVRESAPLEKAFANLGVSVPARMQWTWVKSSRPDLD